MRRNPHYVNSDDHRLARTLRKQSSPVEQKFWFALRQATAKTAIKFRWQQPIHPYVVDFACMKAKLIVELDGMSHDSQVDYDQRRDAYLRKQGYLVVRISNSEVVKSLPDTVESIVRYADSLLNSEHPLTSKN
jgi:very-short-patch-repair endonuclease